MCRKKLLITIAAVALGIAGAVSSAQAGSKDDDGYGGIKIGPLGQVLGGPPAEDVFGSAPLTTKHLRGNKPSKGQRD